MFELKVYQDGKYAAKEELIFRFDQISKLYELVDLLILGSKVKTTEYSIKVIDGNEESEEIENEN